MVTIEKMTAQQLFARPDWGRFEMEYQAMAYPEMAGPGVLRSYYEQCTDAGAATMLVASDGDRTLGLACFLSLYLLTPVRRPAWWTRFIRANLLLHRRGLS